MPKFEKSPERLKSEAELQDAQIRYKALQEQQMKSIASGDSWTPWLDIQKSLINQTKLMPNERAMRPQGNYFTPESDKRDIEFERQKAIAEAIAARAK